MRLSETRPVLLWLQAFRLRFKPSTLARQHRSAPDEGFVIAAAPPPSSSPDTTDKLTICPPHSHTTWETLGSSTLFHEFKTQNASHVGFTSQLLQSMTDYKGPVSSLAKKNHILPLLTCITNLLHPFNKNMAQPSPGPEGSTDNAASPL